MDDFLLRIATINLNENIKLIEKLYENIPGINSDLPESIQIAKITSTVGSDLKFYYLEISEELDSFNLNTRFLALSKLLFSFIKNRNFNFMLTDKIDENFYRKNIEKSNDLGFVNELVKSLNYFMTKFVEFPK
jgi:hypothetical protein